jgi:hypothetical protein
MVSFKISNGNDMMDMDYLRECDVNVKEKGRMIRKNEFIVWKGKGKK